MRTFFGENRLISLILFVVLGATIFSYPSFCKSPSTDITLMASLENCPENINATLSGPDPNCSVPVTWTPPKASPKGQVQSLTSTHEPGDQFGIGTTTVIYTAVFKKGDVLTCSFDVIVNVASSYAIANCPADITVNLTNSCDRSVNWTPPSTRCGITLSSNYVPDDIFPIGITEVQYQASFNGTVVANCSFDVRVNDNIAPQVNSCSNNISKVANNNCEAIATWPTPSFSDNCTANLNITSNFNSGDVFNLGTTTVNYVATDDAGNEATCSFLVSVTDQTAPVFTSCPADFRFSSNENCQKMVTWAEPTTSDNCTNIVTLVSSKSSGTLFSLGETIVTYTATDGYGNSSTCNFKVTIYDETSPVISNCPSNINRTVGANCEAVVSWQPPSATDNCGQVSTESNFNPGNSFSVGTTEVIYTFTDSTGNSSICIFEVIVEGDNGITINQCPSNIDEDLGPNCEAVVSWQPPFATSDCGQISTESNFKPGDSFSVGVTEVIYTFTDSNGNSSICNFDVTVEGETSTVISQCPSDIVLAVAADCEAVVSWEPPVATNECAQVNTESNFEPGDSFAAGTTAVVYVFTDEKGNTSECSFNIIISNDQGSQPITCPENILIETKIPGATKVEWEEPAAVSSCSNYASESTHKPGDMFKEGITIVTYTFTNSSGSTIDCSFEVEVRYEPVSFEVSKLVSPNGDGNNDNWIIDGIEDFKENEVVVVDRWGSEIYKAKEYNNTTVVWNGTRNNGEFVPTGTYFYYITIKLETEVRSKKGFIEILKQ